MAGSAPPTVAVAVLYRPSNGAQLNSSSPCMDMHDTLIRHTRTTRAYKDGRAGLTTDKQAQRQSQEQFGEFYVVTHRGWWP